MEAQIAQFLNRGMNQDISVSKASNEFAFRNHNIRITAVNDNTLLSVTNEKGPKKLNINLDGIDIEDSIYGKYLGYAILNEYIVIFTTSSEDDYIYRFNFDGSKIIGKTLYKGDLNFDQSHLIETLPYYESTDVQKVYWVDGYNQPRVINIVKEDYDDSTLFEFHPPIKRFPTIEVKKEYNGNGLFPSGVVQYYISYYNKYGSETGIVGESGLQYISEYNRGESPDKNIVCSFTININNIDTSFDYIRIYSVIRTSINSTPQSKIIADIPISNSSSITYIDTNNVGESIDTSSLLFLGGAEFTASTITQKDGTLFLGDIEVNNTTVPSDIVDYINSTITFTDGIYKSSIVGFSSKVLNIDTLTSQLKYSDKEVRTFKRGEIYRFAIQFQSSSGSWTSPIWVGDKECTISSRFEGDVIKLPYARAGIGGMYNILEKYDYINYRLLMAETNNSTRKILAQGIVIPTVFNYAERVNKSGPYSIASWISRPINSNVNYKHLSGLGNDKTTNLDTCEIQNSINKSPIPSSSQTSTGYIVSFHLYQNTYLQVYIIRADADGITNYENLSINNCKAVAHYYEKALSYSIDSRDTYNEIINFITSKIEFVSLNGLSYDVWKSYIDAVFYDRDSTYGDFVKIGDNTNWISGFFDSGTSGFGKSKNIWASNIVGGAYTYIEVSNTVESSTNKYVNNFYVDNSIVTLYSPEIEDNESLLNDVDLKFRIIGSAGIMSSISDIHLETNTPGIKSQTGLVKYLWNNNSNKTLVNAPTYQDYGWTREGKLNRGSTVNYYLYLWNKKGSLIGQTINTKDSNGEEFKITYADLKHKVFATKRTLDSTRYIVDTNYYDIRPTTFNSDSVESKVLKTIDGDVIYQGNYENIIATPADETDLSYRSFWNDSYSSREDGYAEVEQYDPVHIKYRTSPHAVFELTTNYSLINILPRFSNEDAWAISKPTGVKYPWYNSDREYYQKSIETLRPIGQYMLIGEIYRDIDYDTLYGGHDENSLKRINWIPISDASSTSDLTGISYGDTFYQRWDCLISCPTTENDLNSVVDITSFMVETHINIDGKYDISKDVLGILNTRKENHNKINRVYSQSNNLFTYNILDDKFNNRKYNTQILFSLQKTPLSDVDTWTNIPMTSALNLDGTYGKLNKIINLNDTLIVFQDKALSTINYNNRTALSVEAGVPIEIANSGKVNGYTVISSSIGCQNKNSICQSASGVYFIDDYNKALFRFNKEGLSNISSSGMSLWFKDNLEGDEYIFYDAKTQDVYVLNRNTCLVYNEGLQTFTSFMDYQGTQLLFNLKGNSFTLYNNKFYEMFGGEYNKIYDKVVDYSVEYKVNPEPLIDKVFGNIEYLADCIPSDVDIDTEGLKHEELPFDRFEAWNEYQSGSTTITTRRKYPNFEKKFRIWRADFPRDSKFKRDRIRNPWVYIKLSKSNTKNNEGGTITENTDKTVFHSLLVKYYK